MIIENGSNPTLHLCGAIWTPSNLATRRAYEAVGFQAEGIARGSAFFGGRHRDEVVMSLLRPDWAAGRQLSARETT
jgi:RimJ/RimL family protein N-acetyltransferase